MHAVHDPGQADGRREHPELLAVLAIAMLARPRRAARRPRSSLLAASAAAMLIHKDHSIAD